MARIHTVYPLGSLFMVLNAQGDSSFCVNDIRVPFCPYEEPLKGKTFIFNKTSMKNFVGQCFLSMLFFHLERQPSAELVNVIYETAIECKALMKTFRTYWHQSIGTTRKNAKDGFFQKFGYCYIASQRHQRVLESVNAMKTCRSSIYTIKSVAMTAFAKEVRRDGEQ